jgi:hypothetical protein
MSDNTDHAEDYHHYEHGYDIWLEDCRSGVQAGSAFEHLEE